MRRREIVLRVRLSAKKVFHPQAWRVRSAGPKPWRRVREGRGEIALAERGKLPKIVTDADIRGILHAHTDRSNSGEWPRQRACAVPGGKTSESEKHSKTAIRLG